MGLIGKLLVAASTLAVLLPAAIVAQDRPETGRTSLAPSTGAAPTAAPTYWSACQIQRYAKSPATGYTTYFSDVFPSDLKTADGKAYQDHHASLLKAYGEHVSLKYGRERDNPQCNVMASEEKMRAIYKTWIDQANKDGKAVMTGWKYTPQ